MTEAIDHDLQGSIGDRLAQRIRNKRREMIVQAVLMSILTPIIAAIAVIAFVLFTPFSDRGNTYWLAGPRCAMTGTLGILFGMMVAYFFAAPIPKRVLADGRWLGAAVWSYLTLAAISYVPGIYEVMGVAFWPVFIVIGLFTLAALGLAYDPKETYYLGWIVGPFILDVPLDYRDDLDRRHLALGFTAVLPSLLVDAWSDIIASRVFFHRWDDEDQKLAVSVIHTLSGARGEVPSDWLLAYGTRRPARVIRVLARLGLVEPGARGLSLTSLGRDLLEESGEERGP
jgi:hypothetical protein